MTLTSQYVHYYESMYNNYIYIHNIIYIHIVYIVCMYLSHVHVICGILLMVQYVLTSLRIRMNTCIIYTE